VYKKLGLFEGVRWSMKIFINYRRDDSSDETKRIYDRLVDEDEFEEETVYRDRDSMPLGVGLSEEIKTQILQSDLLLAVIGRNWLDCEKDGERRLYAPEDWVREEIEIGLEIEINVIPVLVSGAKMPILKKLPETIQPLVKKNRVELRNGLEYDGDMVRLINKLRETPSQIPNRLTRERVLEIIKSARSQGKRPELRNKNLVNIDLNGEDLSGVDFTKANLSFAHLEGLPNLEGTILQDTNLYSAKLYRAHMKNAILRRARLKKANLIKSTLTNADLSEVDFKANVDFEDANMESAKLFEADLSNLDLKKAILKGAEYSSKTIWPDDFDPEEAGAILVR
jgi:hypothetical protein